MFSRDTAHMMLKSDVKRLATIFTATVGLLVLAGCGGGDLIAEATAQADGACECENFECPRQLILLDLDDAADGERAGGLGGLASDGDLVESAGAAGLGAGFVKADRP